MIHGTWCVHGGCVHVRVRIRALQDRRTGTVGVQRQAVF